MKEIESNSSGIANVEGRYANCFEIGYNAFEFIFDFFQCYDEDGQEHPHTRIVTSPAYTKTLLETFKKSVEQYEKTFGAIKEDNAQERT